MGDSLLYYHSGLDPSKSYQIQLINSAGDGTTLTLNDFTILQSNITSLPTYVFSSTRDIFVLRWRLNLSLMGCRQSPSDSSGSGHHKTNVGVIVGPVIAGVAVLVILALLALFLRRRRRRALERAEGKISPYSAEFSSQTPSNGELGSQPNTANLNGVTTIREKGNRTHLLQHPPNQQAVAAPVSNGGGTTGTGTGTHQSSSRPSTPHTHSRSASNPGHAAAPNPTQASSQSDQPQVDVNRIIELIAARIDRPVPNVPTVEDEGAPPPQYPAQPLGALQPLRRPPQAADPTSEPPRYRKR